MTCVDISFTDIMRSDTNAAAVHSCSPKRHLRQMEGHWLALPIYGNSQSVLAIPNRRC